MSSDMAIISRAQQGIRPARIAEMLGLKPETVHTALSCARRRGVDVPRFNTGRPTGRTQEARIAFPGRILTKLETAAQRRNLTTRELARLLLERVVLDDLVDAVLDDADWLKEACATEENNHA